MDRSTLRQVSLAVIRSYKKASTLQMQLILLACAFLVIVGIALLWRRLRTPGKGWMNLSLCATRERGTEGSTPTSTKQDRAGKSLSEKCRGKVSTPQATTTAPSSGLHDVGFPEVAFGVPKNPSLSRMDSRGDCKIKEDKPSGECRFKVLLQTLVENADQGRFEMTELNNGWLLNVALQKNSDHVRSLAISLGQDPQSPRLVVGPQRAAAGGPRASGPCRWEMHGTSGQCLGFVTLQEDGSFLVSAVDKPLLVIEGKDAQMGLRVSMADARLVATVSYNDANKLSSDHVEFHVLPGTDPVFVVSCVLAVLLICVEDEHPPACEQAVARKSSAQALEAPLNIAG